MNKLKNRTITKNRIKFFSTVKTRINSIFGSLGKVVLNGMLVGATITAFSCSDTKNGTFYYPQEVEQRASGEVTVKDPQDTQTHDDRGNYLPDIETNDSHDIGVDTDQDVGETLDKSCGPGFDFSFPIVLTGAEPPTEHTFEVNYGDYIDKDLTDQEEPENNPNSHYPFSVSEISENANPLSNGLGGVLDSVLYPQTMLYRIGGDSYPILQEQVFYDEDSSIQYLETQNIWIGGKTGMYPDPNGLIFLGAKTNPGGLIYSIKFSSKYHESGIPVCTIGSSANKAECVTNPDSKYKDSETATHKVKIMFFGQLWEIMNLVPPNVESKQLNNEQEIVTGGKIKLAKIADHGVLPIGEMISQDNLDFKLISVTEINGEVGAIIQVSHKGTGLIIMDVLIHEGETISYSFDGFDNENEYLNECGGFKIHAYKLAIGYAGPEGSWADISLISKEIELESGQDYGQLGSWKVHLGWKNWLASDQDTQPDHLRSIIFQSNFAVTIFEESGGANIMSHINAWDLKFNGYTDENETKVSLTLTN